MRDISPTSYWPLNMPANMAATSLISAISRLKPGTCIWSRKIGRVPSYVQLASLMVFMEAMKLLYGTVVSIHHGLSYTLLRTLQEELWTIVSFFRLLVCKLFPIKLQRFHHRAVINRKENRFFIE